MIFLVLGVENQLEFEVLLDIKSDLRGITLGLCDSYGTTGPLTCVSNTSGTFGGVCGTIGTV